MIGFPTTTTVPKELICATGVTEEKMLPRNSCKLRGGHLVQPPANSDANISNPVYWRRCDGFLRNALDEPLSCEDGSDHTHWMFNVRLRAVLVPLDDWQAPKHGADDFQKDLVRFAKYKDAFS